MQDLLNISQVLGCSDSKQSGEPRSEMKHILVGSGGQCRVAWRNADGSFAGYGTNCVSSGSTQYWYHGSYTNDSGQYISGYYCVSCGTGNFSNASSCGGV